MLSTSNSSRPGLTLESESKAGLIELQTPVLPYSDHTKGKFQTYNEIILTSQSRCLRALCSTFTVTR
ncbi:hypothetical protein VTN49DRAFT_2363 [Thermomyces lanuginosus]|uniref:uncharacterized protein n=1 Tax=Thermomyces lanuginosus TaxID=5541 RepID=UPI003743E81C